MGNKAFKIGHAQRENAGDGICEEQSTMDGCFMLFTSTKQQAFSCYENCEYQKAIDLSHTALAIPQGVENKEGKAGAFELLGLAYRKIGEFQKALDFRLKCLEITEELGNKVLKGRALKNLGNIYCDIGEYLKAIDCYRERLRMSEELGDNGGVASAYGDLGVVYNDIGEYQKAIDHHREALKISKEIDDKREICRTHANMGVVYTATCEYQKAIDCHRKYLEISEELGDKRGIGVAYGNMAIIYQMIGEYQKAIDLSHKALAIPQLVENKEWEAGAFENLGLAYRKIGEFQKALDFCLKCLEITEELGHKVLKGRALKKLGNIYCDIGEYLKAIDCYRERLRMSEELGDNGGVGSAYGDLGVVYNQIGEYQKAIDYQREALKIFKEIDDKREIGRTHANMGIVYTATCEYQKAIDCHRKHLEISEELGDKRGICTAYGNMANIYQMIGEYQKAIDLSHKALAIPQEVENKEWEAATFQRLGLAYRMIAEFQKALYFHRKTLEIVEELGHKEGKGGALRNMGNVYREIGEYLKAIDCYREHLRISEELGNNRGVASAYGNLGVVYKDIGEYQKAMDYHCEALKISKEIDDKHLIGRIHSNMGNVYTATCEYQKAIDCHRKHLEISEELGDKGEIGVANVNMGSMYQVIGEYPKAIVCLLKGLQIAEELGDKIVLLRAHGSMGIFYMINGEYQESIDCHYKALKIAEEIEDLRAVALAQTNLGLSFQGNNNNELACSFFAKSMLSYQKIRRLGIYKDELNTSISNVFAKVCKIFLQSLLNLKQVKSALLVSDSGKAQALYDLTRRCVGVVTDPAQDENFTIAIQTIADDPYCLETNREEFVNKVLSKVIRLMQDESIVSYTFDILDNLHAWVISRKGVFYKTWKTANGMSTKTYGETINRGIQECLMRNFPKNVSHSLEPAEGYSFGGNAKKNHLDLPLIGNKDHRGDKFTRDLEERVENLMRIDKTSSETINRDPNISALKSLKGRYNLDSLTDSSQKSSEENEKDTKKIVGWYSLERSQILPRQMKKEIPKHQGDPTEQDTALEAYLKKEYSMYISPIEEYLVGSKILVVPEGSQFKIPFCALLNSKKEHLCDRYSLQFTPALQVLNASLSKPLPKIGPALFIGNPIVGEVRFNDEVKSVSQLANAKVEAEECSKYFNAEPLLEEKATKENVLKSMKDASVIHIAAHGHMNHADIFLAPNEGAPKPPSEEHYLLTAKDVVECTLKARLVVLSCCYTGRGQISAEGVVGIARSFLGAGARSVLVSLGRTLDEETMEFMKLFYEKVIQGVSVCVALQQTMIEMKKKYGMAAWSFFQIVGEDISLSKDEIEEIRRQSSAG